MDKKAPDKKFEAYVPSFDGQWLDAMRIDESFEEGQRGRAASEILSAGRIRFVGNICRPRNERFSSKSRKIETHEKGVRRLLFFLLSFLSTLFALPTLCARFLPFDGIIPSH